VTCRASARNVAKHACRSVTPTAPRASSTLNTCDSFSRWSYAGMGSRCSSSRFASCGGMMQGQAGQAQEQGAGGASWQHLDPHYR
jgi:hypothetical protein